MWTLLGIKWKKKDLTEMFGKYETECLREWLNDEKGIQEDYCNKNKDKKEILCNAV